MKTVDPSTNCTTCAFACEVRESPTSLQKHHRCMRLPPNVVAIPIGSALGQVQVQLRSEFPPVAASMICGEWTSAEASVKLAS